MRHLDLTLPTPAENLALDEALLEWFDEEFPASEVLRLWESPQPMVVVGRSSHVHKEVDEAACSERGIPILRRSSGGAAIVAGPGCLMYALVLSFQTRPELRDIGRAHSFVLERLATAMQPLLDRAGNIGRAGTSDLVLRDRTIAAIARKFSGNSLRVKRTHLLYHGTLLYDFDLPLIDTCLRMPPRQPNYRSARAHLDFVTNVSAGRRELAEAISAAWPASSKLTGVPMSRVADLAANRFANDRWTYEFA